MIGYYIHHHGHGHVHRASTIARAVARTHGLEVTGLSSRPRPADWAGPWVILADDAVPDLGAGSNPTAFGVLHHVPTGHPGLRARSAAVSAWIAATGPMALVVDVSVEMAVLARLHGVPVVTVGMPESRHDHAHEIGYGVSDLTVGPWPAAASRWLHGGSPADRLHAVGAIGRFTPADRPADVRRRHAVVLNGTGGSSAADPTSLSADMVSAVDAAGGDWSLEYLAGAGHWVDDPWSRLSTAEVVVSHCGQNAVAEIAAARRPAVLVPGSRPFDEQWATARALRELALPAVVLDSWPAPEQWSALLDRAAMLDGADWVRWNDGGGAERAADLITTVAHGQAPPTGADDGSIVTLLPTSGDRRGWPGGADDGRDHDARIA